MISNHQTPHANHSRSWRVGAFVGRPFHSGFRVHVVPCCIMLSRILQATKEREETIRLPSLRWGSFTTATAATTESTTADAMLVNETERTRQNSQRRQEKLTTEEQTRPAHHPPCPHQRHGVCSHPHGHHGHRHDHGRRIRLLSAHGPPRPSCREAGHAIAAA